MGRKGKIPYLYWNDKPKKHINLSHLRIFGCAQEAFTYLGNTNNVVRWYVLKIFGTNIP